ncbi:hypothetical protein G9C85_03575 [Halorubellus sp. JP-L1]|uniref:hypothetical protein n=1 Tax=Halorubellus sp. JP-L1 TaxID=2715753 RepID=UPI00140751DD|nr:hypothetical protein [Halorubellus sp. JP-L1]NHN40716.1 hypothetical protein [Halorubellus sp. JP-L1]
MTDLATELGATLSNPRRVGLTALAVVVGVALATLHPLGLVAGGALVALPQRSLPRGLLAGVLFGGVVLAVFLVDLAAAGAAGGFLRFGLPRNVAIATGFGLPTFGALARGLR